jgi:hypothetical protein
MAKFQPFDDCEICRAMQAAEASGRELSESELMEAFRKQKESGIGFFGTGADLEKM